MSEPSRPVELAAVGGGFATSSTRSPVPVAEWGPEAARRTLAAREQLLHGPIELGSDLADAVRTDIATSWRRCRLAGVDPGTTPTLPHDPGREPSERLLRAARPVLERLVGELSKTVISLADSSCWIVWRSSVDRALLAGLDSVSAAPGSLLAEDVAGTNGLGSVAETRRPMIVAGPEHYLDAMMGFTCVGVPVLEPMTGRLAGVLDLTCRYQDTNEHLLPLIAQAAREIEYRLADGVSSHERALFDAFARTARTPALAVASLNDEYLFTNAQAAQLFDPADHALLWDWASPSVHTGRTVTGEVRLTRGRTVSVRCVPVEANLDTIGALITMRPARPSTPARPRRRQRGTDAVLPVWDRLLGQTGDAVASRRCIMLSGEPGTGKTVLARAVHAALGDAGPLLEVDCALWDSASLTRAIVDPTATLLLRHSDCLDHRAAMAVLAHLERCAARVLLTGSPTDAEPSVFGRLADRTDYVVEVPPLRERREDIPGLTTALIADIHPTGLRPRCSSDAVSALIRQEWPGNVAELRRVLSTALVNSRHGDVVLDDLPAAYRALGSRARPLASLEQAERSTIVAALRRSEWHHADAAAELGISRATIYRKIKKLGIHRPARS